MTGLGLALMESDYEVSVQGLDYDLITVKNYSLEYGTLETVHFQMVAEVYLGAHDYKEEVVCIL